MASPGHHRADPLQDSCALPFWQSARSRKLVFQRCGATGLAVWPPRRRSPFGGGELIWTRSSGCGTLYSFSTLHRAPDESWRSALPYSLGFVELEEGYLMFSEVVEADALSIGMRLKVRFDQRGGLVVPIFAPEQ